MDLLYVHVKLSKKRFYTVVCLNVRVQGAGAHGLRA